MNTILELNLNEFVTQKVDQEITALNQEIARLRAALNTVERANTNQKGELGKLNQHLKTLASLDKLSTTLRTRFENITANPPDNNGWFDGKNKNQYNFIEKLMDDIFGIKPATAWLSSRGDGQLQTYLAVGYAHAKQELISLLEILIPDTSPVYFRDFQMPSAYPREVVLEFVKAPPYCTNGAMFGITQYWVEAGAKKANLPHDLIMQNPHILEDEIFATVLETIRNKRGEYCNLFALPKHNPGMSDTQITALGACLLTVKGKAFQLDVIAHFIKMNILKFNPETLDYLFAMATSDNEFRTFHWTIFPAEYQKKFLSKMLFDDALKALTSYSTKLSTEEKQAIMRGILIGQEK